MIRNKAYTMEDGKVGYIIVGVNDEILNYTIYKNEDKARRELSVIKNEFSNASIVVVDIME